MYMYVDTAIRDRKCHNFGTNKKVIKSGEKHLIICNGTIGQGRRAKNINTHDAISMLEGIIKELKDQDLNKIVKPSYDNIDFSGDDIPF